MKRVADQTSINSFFGTPTKRHAIATPDGKPANSPKKSSRHRETFYKPWLQKYTWIVYEDDEGMFCALCTKHKQQPKNGSTNWIKTPCQSYREDDIRRHRDSTCHRVAVDLEANRKITNKSGGIQQALHDVVTVEDQAFMALLRCMYFLMRKELPHTTNFGDLLDLAQDIGCSYLDAVRGDEVQKKYQSCRTMQEMVWCLGETVREEIISDLRRSPFFSVLIDETTDVAVMKQLIVYVKYINGNTMETKFLTMEDLIDGKADTIVQKLKDIFRDIEVPLPGRLSALGSDGAAVMVGCRNGVSTQLRKESSILVNNHCVAHRLALAVRQTADHIPELKRFNKHLQDLFFFYENSPVRLAALREIQKTTDDPVLKPTQPKALTHDHACATLRQILPSIMMALEREAQERHDSLALGLAKNIQTVQFIYILPHDV